MIKENARKLLEELPEVVQLVAACKGRAKAEILDAIDGGIRIIGENYIQEAEAIFNEIGNKVKWHFIGHLQKNKVKKAIQIFDMIETIDSAELAKEINKFCGRENKIMPVLIEVNSGREKQKFGVFPENIEAVIRDISMLEHVRITGLMTMGPEVGDPEVARPYFLETRKIFSAMKQMNIDNVEMRYLSMGMSNSYKVAIEEGANIVRIGTKIFGERS